MENLEVRPAASAAPARRRSAFVFPTALEKERGSVAPVRLGLDRPAGRRRTTGSTRRVRTGGGGLRGLGVVLLFLALAVVGAYLGLAAAHRTDLLARVGLPVPAALAPAPASVPPAVTAPGSTAEPVPAAKTSPTAEGRAPGTGTPPAVVAGSAVAANPPSPPPAGPSTPALPAPAAAPASTPSATPEARSAASARAGSTEPAATGATSGPTPGAGAPAPGGRAGERGRAAGTGVAAGSAARTEPPVSGEEASEARVSKPATTASRESDRDKLLGAFADLDSAKESTVRLESTPRLRVRMGGKMLGTTPVTVTLPAQDAPVDLEFFDTGLGLSRTEQVTLKPGDNGTHRVVIPKGKLVLKLQDGVAVSVDGKAVGTTPLAPLSLYEGSHVVQLTRGDQKERRTLEISGEEPTELEFSFPEEE